MTSKHFERLPTTVVPSHYAVKLTPDLQAFTFSGSVSINVQVKEVVSSIVLNCQDIVIKSAVYAPDGEDAMTPTDMTLSDEEATARLTFPTALSTGTGVLSIIYSGTLSDQMKGFYRSKYTTPEGETRYAATTQFESTDARRAFPCWDEPAVKATFDVTLVVPKDRVALSNMPVVKDEPLADDPSLRLVTFDRTPIMSTYLLAFIVGEYDFIEEKDADGVLVRVYTPVGKKEQGRFALEASVKVLPFYKEYFGIPYPLPKMDLIAIADFAMGAMENWGLVTYRESALLIDPDQSSVATKMWVAIVVCHELAHQWFGNLVTMEWWTHLWLNEGFASFMEYLSVDWLFPEFDIWTQFFTHAFSSALRLDSMNSSHPIEVSVGHPDEVEEIFDEISYSKGACVIRMLHDWLSDETFRKGMNLYLTKFQYKNTFTEDLWASLGEASGLPVAEVMSTWTAQMGYPVISVSERQEGDNRVLTVSQEKFCADGKKPEDSFLWQVPLKFIVSGKADSTVTYLLKEKSGEVVIPNVQAGDVIKANPGSVGFYRVQYDSEMTSSLTRVIHSLPAPDRLGVLNDTFSFARAGRVPMSTALSLVASFENEVDYTVWTEILSNLGSSVSAWARDTDFEKEFNSFTKGLLQKITAKLGWDKKEGEGPLNAMLRSMVLSRMGRMGHEPTIAEAQRRLDQHLSGEKDLPADLRNAVYGGVLKNGPPEYFNKMLQYYDKLDMQEEMDRVSTNLGSTTNEENQDMVIQFAMSEKVRNQDLPYVMAGITGSNSGRDKVWDLYRKNSADFVTKFGPGSLLNCFIRVVTRSFTSSEKADEVESFFKTNPAPSIDRTLEQSLENIRLNAEMKARDSASVREFLDGLKE